ncbi:site-2 protease family protein [Patescibacteria group bacterium]|nr:site-2 protease family protein [Patescibacteria group bacterium]
MILTILIVFFTLIGLLVLHELGHFILAKKFGVEVEEFGIGYPPRIFGKKIGETIYSLNLLPFGAFVRIKGEEGKIGVEDARSFSGKPIWQRTLILVGGVVSFWIIAILILSFVAFKFGLPTAISDEANQNITGAEVQIVQVSEDSPAQMAGISVGDIITKLKSSTDPHSKNEKLKIDKVKEVQEFTEENLGQEVTLTIKRGKEVFDINLTPRVSPPEGEGAMGVGLVRRVLMKYPWYQAPLQGVLVTSRQTIAMPIILGEILGKAIQGEKVEGVKFVGPIGIGEMMGQALRIGFGNFLLLVAMISIWLALFNLLPIPAVDGGRLLFLGIEKVKGSPVNPNLERNITALFFTILVILMIFITIKDILRLF